MLARKGSGPIMSDQPQRGLGYAKLENLLHQATPYWMICRIRRNTYTTIFEHLGDTDIKLGFSAKYCCTCDRGSTRLKANNSGVEITSTLGLKEKIIHTNGEVLKAWNNWLCTIFKYKPNRWWCSNCLLAICCSRRWICRKSNCKSTSIRTSGTVGLQWKPKW